MWVTFILNPLKPIVEISVGHNNCYSGKLMRVFIYFCATFDVRWLFHSSKVLVKIRHKDLR